jgi:hypothetical protein
MPPMPIRATGPPLCSSALRTDDSGTAVRRGHGPPLAVLRCLARAASGLSLAEGSGGGQRGLVRRRPVAGSADATRVGHLQTGGGLNDPYLLTGSTVSDDAGAIDNLFGEGDTDWFLASSGDLNDAVGGETVTPIP